MKYIVKFENEVIGSVTANHSMTDEEICEMAGVALAITEEDFMNMPENGMYDLSELEIIEEAEEEHRNENIFKFYKLKEAETQKLKDRINAAGIDADTAVKLYGTRHDLIIISDKPERGLVEMQAGNTSDACLRALYGDAITEEMLDLLEAYEKLTCHLRAIKDVVNDDTALLIRDYETIGEDNYDIVGIGHICGREPEYYSLSNYYNGKMDKYTDSEWEPTEEKKQKCMEIWKEKGMI